VSFESWYYLSFHKRIFAQSEIVIIENLTGLGKIGKDLFTFYALPIKYENAYVAPIRAVAILNLFFAFLSKNNGLFPIK
jgi:kynurenine formamidase